MNEWPSNVPGPRRRPKKAKGSSGKGSGTTVGMSIAALVVGSALTAVPVAVVVYRIFA